MRHLPSRSGTQPEVGREPQDPRRIRRVDGEGRCGGFNPETTTSRPAVNAYATVDYNQNRVAKITPLVEGIVQDIAVVPGQKVAAGEILGTVNSPDFAEIKSRFLAANAAKKLAGLQAGRERKLADKKISAAADLETAEAAAEVADVDLSAGRRQRLLNLGLSESEIDLLASDGRPTSLLTLKAPFTSTSLTATFQWENGSNPAERSSSWPIYQPCGLSFPSPPAMPQTLNREWK